MIPNATPDIAFSMAVDDLYAEAANFIDGAPVETQGQADALAKLITDAKQIRKDADAARKVEKQPHDDAAKEVQARWLPILSKAEDVVTAIQRPLTTWLQAQEAEQRRLADEARAEADRLAVEAIAAVKTSVSLEDLTATRELQDAAVKAGKIAKQAGKAKSHVQGGGRAIGLRTYWGVTMTDGKAAVQWAMRHHADDLREYLLALAKRDVSAGTRAIPGFVIQEERKVA